MIISFDLETTGLDKYNDEIIEIALVKFDEKTFEIIDVFSTFVNPNKPIPDIISNVTWIYDADVENAPLLNDIKKEILEFIWDLPLLWHNVFFDIDFFIEKWINIKNNIYLDTFFIANFLLFNEQSFNLEMLCNALNIGFKWAHRAINDAKATILLFKNLLKIFKKLSNPKKELIHFIFQQSWDKSIKFLENIIFWEEKSKINLVDFETKILKIIKKHSFDWEMIFDKDLKKEKTSSIFNTLWNLIIRENQVKMTDIIFDTFKNKKHIVIEAPTWLWKSFAYLIPAIYHSLKTNEKVFISTKTKNLQDQLFYKDLAFLRENLKVKFNYVKIKWRKNYLSVKWFFDEFILWDFEYEKVFFMCKLLLWIFETEHWELDELNFFWKEYNFLKIINLNLSLYSKNSSKYQLYEYLYKARQNLAKSNIVIINNSLLFSDLKNESSILWNIQNLVMDEAHSIEDSVTDSLKSSLDIKLIEDIFWIIEKILVKKEVKKIDFLKYKEELLLEINLIFDNVFAYINKKFTQSSQFKNTLLYDDFFEDNDYSLLLKKINLDFISIIDFLSWVKEYDFINEKSILQEFLDLINIVFTKDFEKKYIKILSYEDKKWVSIEYTLLNPWKYLKENIYSKVNSIILTSATLKILESFDYFKNLLYLNDFDFYSFESDFDYKKQATLFIPTDLWYIKNNSDEIINFLLNFFIIVRWNTLMLLTSFNMIRKVYTSLNFELKKHSINLYAQSIWWSKIKLINSFLKSSSNSILLWTNSFWEWVDIPWDDLKYLIIHKFPFSVPTDPIFLARSEIFSDPFADYWVPKAILKLKQWFWRLIRSNSDTWLVILLDDRINNQDWWKKFFDAFPKDINIKFWNSKQFIDVLKNKINY